MTLTRNNFSQNSITSESGGAVSIFAEYPDTKVELTGNTLKGNKVTGSYADFGGAMSYVSKGVLTICNNKIQDNTVLATEEGNYGLKWSHGGGLSIESPINGKYAKYPLDIKLEGNIISGNTAQIFGGGIYFNLTKNNGDRLSIQSGLFENNHSDFAGGAIDYSCHNQPALHLENAVITGNKAVTGAGIWACPTSSVESHSTFGASISENQLLPAVNPPGSKADWQNPFPSGTDVRFEGEDTTFREYLDGNNSAVHKMSLADRTFIGDLTTWYKDNMEDLYQEGDTPLKREEYTQRSTSLGALSALPAAALERSNAAADVIFRNNTAGVRGGAISTNSDVVIGKPEDVSLQVKKIWLDQAGKTIEEICLRLSK